MLHLIHNLLVFTSGRTTNRERQRENGQAYVVCLFIHAVGKVLEKLVGQNIVAINKQIFFLLMHGKSWLAFITQQMLVSMKHWMYCRFWSY